MLRQRRCTQDVTEHADRHTDAQTTLLLVTEHANVSSSLSLIVTDARAAFATDLENGNRQECRLTARERTATGMRKVGESRVTVRARSGGVACDIVVAFTHSIARFSIFLPTVRREARRSRVGSRNGKGVGERTDGRSECE